MVTRSRRSALSRFHRSESGATAVEFALISIPFFTIIFATVEIAMAFWVTQTLETAVANASRQIYTGQFQTSSGNQNLTAAQLQANFKTLVCQNVVALFDCNALVAVDIRSASSFAGASPSMPVTNGVYDTSSFSYQSGGSGAITVVRAAMQYPSLTGFVGNASGLNNGNRLIMATAVFKTEPY